MVLIPLQTVRFLVRGGSIEGPSLSAEEQVRIVLVMAAREHPNRDSPPSGKAPELPLAILAALIRQRNKSAPCWP